VAGKQGGKEPKGKLKKKKKCGTPHVLCGSTRGVTWLRGLTLQATSPNKLTELVVVHAIDLLRPTE